MIGMTVDTHMFDEATKALAAQARANTLAYAQSCAQEAQTRMKSDARWQDQSGIARVNLTASASQSGDKTVIVLSGSAPNRSRHSKYPDYMEILEFGHNSLDRAFPDLSIIYPTATALSSAIRAAYGDAVFRGQVRCTLPRSREAQKQRSAKSLKRAIDRYKSSFGRNWSKHNRYKSSFGRNWSKHKRRR